VEEDKIERNDTEPEEEVPEELPEVSIIDVYRYEHDHVKYDTQEDLHAAGGCAPDEHEWHPGFSFGTELCNVCRAVRRRRK